MSLILKDSYGRPIRDLRVSLTDRCNFRCFYCLPHGEPPIAPKEQMLSYEEIEYVCEIFVSLGIQKIRLTGGEPMMRRDIETIIQKLAKLKSLTTSDALQFVEASRKKSLGPDSDKLKYVGHDECRCHLYSEGRSEPRHTSGEPAATSAKCSLPTSAHW